MSITSDKHDRWGDATPVLDVKGVARYAGVSEDAVRAVCRQRLLPHIRLDDRIYVAVADCERYYRAWDMAKSAQIVAAMKEHPQNIRVSNGVAYLLPNTATDEVGEAPVDIEKLNNILEGSGIRVINAFTHSKASERSADVVIVGTDDHTHWWDGPIPYQDPRAHLNLLSEQEVADYLREVKPCFEPLKVAQWRVDEAAHWDANFANAAVTRAFFDVLLGMEWVAGSELPPNSNRQRRLQDIRDKGYTVVFRAGGRGTESRLKLVPLPRRDARTYEGISSRLRKRILGVLTPENIYDLTSGNRAGLLPDHKFPEIRWDANTPGENRDDMPEEEIRQKFQILDNRRNQQKREACRRCYQTDERGTLFGIQFYYEGGPRWDEQIPKSGADAEKGCVGCGWYDIHAWREALAKRLNETQGD